MMSVAGVWIVATSCLEAKARRKSGQIGCEGSQDQIPQTSGANMCDLQPLLFFFVFGT